MGLSGALWEGPLRLLWEGPLGLLWGLLCGLSGNVSVVSPGLVWGISGAGGACIHEANQLYAPP